MHFLKNDHPISLIRAGCHESMTLVLVGSFKLKNISEAVLH